MSDPVTSSTASSALGENLALREQEQLALAASYLSLMNAALEGQTAPAALKIRDAFRATLADGPLGPADSDCVLPFERKQDEFEDRLLAAADTGRCLTLLVDLCASQPFAEIDRPLHEYKRMRALSVIAIGLGGKVDEDDVERIDAFLREGQKTSKSQTLKWILLGLGGLAGIATAGLAAPAIGAAIGGAMGLSGAAATAAGLAAVGGGSLAAGGLGMAGGTAIIMAAGGAFGAGLGTLIGGGMTTERIEVEAIKLFALIRALDYYASRSTTDAANFRRLAKDGRKALRALHTSLGEAAQSADDAKERERESELRDTEAAVGRLCRGLAA